jgi:hypothetical protein
MAMKLYLKNTTIAGSLKGSAALIKRIIQIKKQIISTIRASRNDPE